MIKKIRHALGESQVEFAKHCDADQPMVSRWENTKNKRQPNVKTAKKIIRISEKENIKISKKTNEVIKTSAKNGYRNIVLEDIYA